MGKFHWIFLTGCIWCIAGLSLSIKGFGYLASMPFFIAISALIGLCKGHFIFSRTVDRVVKRLSVHEGPIALRNVYTPGYWVLLLGMISLGIILKTAAIPTVVRGTVDLGVGTALIYGSALYWRHLWYTARD
ncbi:MAG: hypothetical protein RL235_905 [Chlamydiota bacterium]|jgi:hypothetical protein